MSISLKIKGNKFSSEGVGIDHVAIGDKAFFVTDRQYPPVNRAGYGIVVQHYPDKSVYTLVITNVSSVDGSRQGSLYIALSVPRGECVKGLYYLMIQLADFYRNNYLTQFGNGYRFTDRKENEADFAAIIAGHPVAHYPYRTVTSAEGDAVAYICAPVEDVASILDDPMRDEFAAYSKVVLIPGGNPADATLSVAAKLMRPYALTVNGLKVQTTVTDPDKPLNITVPESKTLQSATVRFTLNEARLGNIPGASVIIDDFTQTVNINVHQQRKPQPLPPVQPIPTGATKSRLPIIISSAVVALIVIGAVCYFTGIIQFGNKVEKAKYIVEDPVEVKSEEQNLKEKLMQEGENENPDAEEDAGEETVENHESVGGEDAQEETPTVGETTPATPTPQPVEDQGTPVQDQAVKDAFDNYCNQLMLKTSMTKGDFKNIKNNIETFGFTNEQKTKILGLIDEHKQLHEALSTVKDNPKGLKKALEGFAKTSKITNLKSYVNDKLKLSDSELNSFAVRFGIKQDDNKLYN